MKDPRRVQATKPVPPSQPLPPQALPASSGSAFWLLVVILLATGMTQLAQLELFEQQRVALQSGVGSRDALDILKERGDVKHAAGESCATAETDTTHTTAPMPADHVLRSFCYMDELFHVPQTLRFAVLNNFSYYDPMITTPPGSYLPGVAALHVLKKTPHPDDDKQNQQDFSGSSAALPFVTAWKGSKLCDLEVAASTLPLWARAISGAIWSWSCGSLRQALDGISAAFEVIGVPPAWLKAVEAYAYPNTFGAFVHFLRRLGSTLHGVLFAFAVWLAFKLRLGNMVAWGVTHGALYPPLLLSTALVYTDSISAVCVVMMLLIAPSGMEGVTPIASGKMLVVAAVGLCSLAVRQTNIVWLFFVCGRFFLERSIFGGLTLRKLLRTVAVLLPSVLVAAAFVAFVVWNDGIVLGDKSSHQAVFHPAQLSYLGATCAVFFPFQTLLAVHQQLIVRRRTRVILLLSALIAWSLGSGYVHFHPYLIADNRHYTNVLYRKVLQDETLRIRVVVPLATAGWLLLLDAFLGVSGGANTQALQELVKGRTNLDAKQVLLRISTFRTAMFALFVICCGVCCIPQKLIEFRYFVPCVLVALTSGKFFTLSRTPSHTRLVKYARAMDVGVAVATHAVCCVVFLYKTFPAPDGTTGRFMW